MAKAKLTDLERKLLRNIARNLGEVHCECGKWSGEYCSWSGPRSQTVLVEYMPQHLRTLHDDTHAAGVGVYPHNGAIRVRVELSCGHSMVKYDGEWVSVVV